MNSMNKGLQQYNVDSAVLRTTPIRSYDHFGALTSVKDVRVNTNNSQLTNENKMNDT